eukprot:3936872-Rhodomonas_salina.3
MPVLLAAYKVQFWYFELVEVRPALSARLLPPPVPHSAAALRVTAALLSSPRPLLSELLLTLPTLVVLQMARKFTMRLVGCSTCLPPRFAHAESVRVEFGAGLTSG